MSSSPHRLFAYAAAASVLFLLAGCGATGVATVRVIQLSPGTASIDAFASNTQVAVNLPYANASTYTQVSDGEHTVELTPAGEDNVKLYSQVVDVFANTNLTVIAVNPVAGIGELVLTDNNEQPDANDFKLRIVNASPTTANTGVDVYVTAPSIPLTASIPATFKNLAYATAETYLELPAGSYQVRFTTPGTQTVVATGTAFTPNVGDIYTVALADSPSGGAPLQVYPYTDATFSTNADQ
jgi:hypothetical protein